MKALNSQIQPQLPFTKTERRGGVRRNAGRKPKGLRAGVSHRTRGVHKARHPVHVTMRAREGLPSFRSDKLALAGVLASIDAGQTPAFRIVHFSVQSNHLHLVVEAHDQASLARGMQGLSVRMARAINRALGGKGSVFADRYHSRELESPRETRAALLYVLQNWAKHGRGGDYDPHSSAASFDGWTVSPPSTESQSIVSAPRTWLVTVGWRRHGLLRPGEKPARHLAQLPA